MLNRIEWRRPIAGLTAKQAAATETFRRARANGAGIVDSILQARWMNALRESNLETIRQSKRRTAAARKGWKTRRAKAF